MGADLKILDTRMENLRLHLRDQKDQAEVTRFYDLLDLSWIYHDFAMDAVVLTHQELQDALDHRPVSDTTTALAFEEVRKLKEALAYARERSQGRKRFSLTLDLFKQVYTVLDPEEQNYRAVKYRKDIPLHRMYFHEISPPEKISYRMRKLQEFIQTQESERTHTVQLASRVHYRFLSIFPFAKYSGRVARLIMNMILMRGGYAPAIIHAIERQRYYEALRGSVQNLTELIVESIFSTVEAHEKYFQINPNDLSKLEEEQTRKKNSAVPRKKIVSYRN